MEENTSTSTSSVAAPEPQVVPAIPPAIIVVIPPETIAKVKAEFEQVEQVNTADLIEAAEQLGVDPAALIRDRPAFYRP